MKHFLFVFALYFLIQSVQACHPSCNCFPGTSTCSSCIDLNSSMDPRNLSCPCNLGWYTAHLIPYQCSKAIVSKSCNQNSTEVMDPCVIEIGRKIRDVEFQFINEYNNITKKISQIINLDFSHISIAENCLDFFTSKLQILPQNDTNYIDFPEGITTSLARGGQLFNLTNDQVVQYATTTTSAPDLISYILKLKILIGTEGSFDRAHLWNLIIQSSTKNVAMFSLSEDAPISNGCIQGIDDCIAVANLDTTSQICTDITCQNARNPVPFQVGEDFIANIKFADQTYIKRLVFDSLFMKLDDNSIFNLSSNTTISYLNNTLIVKVKLSQPSLQAILQLNMHIDTSIPLNLRRILSSSTQANQLQQQFVAVILSKSEQYEFMQAIFSSKITLQVLLVIILSIIFL